MATFPTLTDPLEWTDEDLEVLRIKVLTEQEARRTLDTSQQQIDAAASAYRAAADRTIPSGTVPTYQVGQPYPVGYEFMFNGTKYRVRQTHTTQADWTPNTVLALYEVVPTAPAGGGTPAWQAGVSYALNALVTYNGSTYKCIQAHTSQVGWEPAGLPSLWQKQ